MNPAQRAPRTDEADRDFFLRACAHIWDHSRTEARAQMLHGANQILSKLGGKLILIAECTHRKRTVPEAAFMSEYFVIADGGRGLL